jgi:hypothetical protein
MKLSYSSRTAACMTPDEVILIPLGVPVSPSFQVIVVQTPQYVCGRDRGQSQFILKYASLECLKGFFVFSVCHRHS